MESKGPLQKIVVWKDQERNTTWLIDGRNRLKACQDLRIEIKEAIYKDFQNDDEVRTFINGINEQRRHMTKQQRTAVALEMMEVQKKLGRERQSQAGKKTNGGRKTDGTKVMVRSQSKKSAL